jgi:RNA recognition motif-containing protein
MSLKLYVGGLPYATTSEDLAGVFGRYGHLVAATVIADRMTGRSKGFGFVEFGEEADGRRAVDALNGSAFGGRNIVVNEARPFEDRPRRDFGNPAPELESGISVGTGDTLEASVLATIPVPPHLLQINTAVNEQLLRRLAQNPSELRSSAITSRVFEELIAEIWDGFGYVVELTKRTRDGGRDVIAIRRVFAEERFLIECKRPTTSSRIGVRPVRELFGVKHHEGATKAILATTAYFTRGATMLFEDHRWELEGRDFDGIVDWLATYNLLKSRR